MQSTTQPLWPWDTWLVILHAVSFLWNDLEVKSLDVGPEMSTFDCFTAELDFIDLLQRMWYLNPTYKNIYNFHIGI